MLPSTGSRMAFVASGFNREGQIFGGLKTIVRLLFQTTLDDARQRERDVGELPASSGLCSSRLKRPAGCRQVMVNRNRGIEPTIALVSPPANARLISRGGF